MVWTGWAFFSTRAGRQKDGRERCRRLLCRSFWGGSAQQSDSVPGPKLSAVLGSAGSGTTVVFAPPHTKGCPQQRGTTRSSLDIPLSYPGLVASFPQHLFTGTTRQTKAVLWLFNRIILFIWRQFPSSERGKPGEKSQRCCPASLLIALTLWSSLRIWQ